IKYAYVLAQVAKVEKLEVTEEELEKEIAAMAEKSGRKPLAIRAKLEAEKRLDSLKNQLLDRKTADFLLANNTVEKVAAKPAEAESEKKE
ncbi:trigger factor, partial [Candidatus Sumerlaeota bacterium]|nr:trigger factor [Candidatus Sumerlaeota bacterium]